MPLKFSAYETVLKNEDKSPSESCIPFSEVKKKKSIISVVVKMLIWVFSVISCFEKERHASHDI